MRDDDLGTEPHFSDEESIFINPKARTTPIKLATNLDAKCVGVLCNEQIFYGDLLL